MASVLIVLLLISVNIELNTLTMDVISLRMFTPPVRVLPHHCHHLHHHYPVMFL